MRVFDDLARFTACVGQELGVSEWMTVDQERVDTFADATGDHQWIHVNRELAARGPFGTTIAHGYLSLSLLPGLVRQVFRIEGVRMAVNYGLNRVRFPSPVPVGSRVRVSAALLSAKEAGGGVEVVLRATLEVEGSGKPACVAETVGRYYPEN
ncbi:MaoC family dehydratase [Spongiactinospora sp. TRM90649]|uniref:MaoC family dehydratase n=1 Tax=Spongiactinospora sp. TRM90649 TaxID=3031114 RepID=UPI0023F8EAE9|nr:MaoC family dehydratase [Spongiactinospora sp. TRM90649]MDF5752240.1 MaoC family dehydratase [Spongiactinospora sp. TRM90649]